MSISIKSNFSFFFYQIVILHIKVYHVVLDNAMSREQF